MNSQTGAARPLDRITRISPIRHWWALELRGRQWRPDQPFWCVRVPRIVSHGLTWPDRAGPEAVSSAFGCASISCSGTVGSRDFAPDLPCFARVFGWLALLAGQTQPKTPRLGASSSGRGAPAHRRHAQAIVGRPRPLVRGGSAAPRRAPLPVASVVTPRPANRRRPHRARNLKPPRPRSLTDTAVADITKKIRRQPSTRLADQRVPTSGLKIHNGRVNRSSDAMADFWNHRHG
jgi:hypothetical protein